MEACTILWKVNYGQHFVPLLSSIKKDIESSVKVSREEVYGVVDKNGISQSVGENRKEVQNFSSINTGTIYILQPAAKDKEEGQNNLIETTIGSTSVETNEVESCFDSGFVTENSEGKKLSKKSSQPFSAAPLNEYESSTLNALS